MRETSSRDPKLGSAEDKTTVKQRQLEKCLATYTPACRRTKYDTKFRISKSISKAEAEAVRWAWKLDDWST